MDVCRYIINVIPLNLLVVHQGHTWFSWELHIFLNCLQHATQYEKSDKKPKKPGRGRGTETSGGLQALPESAFCCLSQYERFTWEEGEEGLKTNSLYAVNKNERHAVIFRILTGLFCYGSPKKCLGIGILNFGMCGFFWHILTKLVCGTESVRRR